ncbi:uncharacterized protein BX663DRAFT_514982 [Cokeromyces recurvatus]|uniref:uncharacterized protein n=1 Tax=Cokeromyces recurvatus TaxID=90255 RepID=UPI00221E9B12|nr:uncharacterized protein BX663DRAFT_514982 [Cokeromyces recurvatus]KAI7901114.1 hypothetical protein BX663DRAFT_514982 [Cokeromyces recurvatus]
MFCLGSRKKQNSRSHEHQTSYITDDKSTLSHQGESILTLFTNQSPKKQQPEESICTFQLQEEYSELKSKNMEYLDIINKQVKEIEQLKNTIHTYQTSIRVTDGTRYPEQNKEIALVAALTEKEDVLKENNNKDDSFVVVSDNNEIIDETCYKQLLEEKDRLLQEKQVEIEELKFQWETERAELIKPALEQVVAQLEELKETNKIVTERLTEKEGELVELRAELNRRDRKPKIQLVSNEQEKQKRLNRLTMDLENDRLLIQRLDELNQQLKTQKQKHESILKSHAKVIAEKDKVLQEHEKLLKELKGTHENATRALEQEHLHNLNQLQLKYQRQTNELSKRLKQAESQAKSNVNNELDKILVEFEQSQHNHSVQVASLKQSYQKRVSVMLQGQQAEIRSLINYDKNNNSHLQQNKLDSLNSSNINNNSQPIPPVITGNSSDGSISKLRNNSKYVWPPIVAA